MKSKEVKLKRPTLLEGITQSAAQHVAHDCTTAIGRRKDMVIFESVLLQAEVDELKVRLSSAQAKLRVNEAVLSGYNQVVAKR